MFLESIFILFFPNKRKQISAFNRKVNPEILDIKIKPYLNPTDQNVVIGDDVIRLNPNGDFNLHFPIRRGDFNLHGGVGGKFRYFLF